MLEEALSMLVACHSPGYLFIHSGVVELHGRALLLPGRSGAGKSTLTRALVALGATYFSDEYAALTPDGRVAPYPRALALRQPTRRIPANKLGWKRSLQPISVGWVVDCQYTGHQRLKPQERAQSFASLFGNAIAAQTRADQLLPCLARTAIGARHLIGERGDAQDTARWLISWMEER